MFVKLWQFDLADRTHVRVDTNKMAQASAAGMILDRGCGKPTQPMEGRLDVSWHVSDQPMSPDEWRKQFTDQ
jgi:hypothetical protein